MDEHERERRATRARELVPGLAADGVVGVAVTSVDLAGITRTKGFPLRRLPDVAAWGVGSSVVFDTYGTDDLSIPAPPGVGGPVGDLRLHPDVERLTRLPATPGWAWAPADRYAQDGSAHPLDTRLLLARVVEALAADGFTARAAFEVECVLSAGDADGPIVPPTTANAYGISRLLETADLLRDVLTALDGAGVDVGQIHPEYGTGQFEVSVAAEDPLSAADTSVLVRQTIRGVALRHGLRVSFAPKVGLGDVGNGGHVHVSLQADGVNTMAGGDGPAGMTRPGEGFAAGVLAHLPGLLALGAPSAASWLRLEPSQWAGAWAAWGVENRETALRFVAGAAGEHGRAANLEVKAFDLAANPYLLLAGVLAAGAAGTRAGLRLPAPVQVDPAGLDAAARAAAGVDALPAGLAAAADALAADEVLGAALGEQLTATVVAHRRAEVERFAGQEPAAIAAATRWVW